MTPATPRRSRRVLVEPGIELHAVLQGSEDGAPVLLLHGFPDCWSVWRPVMDRLGPDRFVVALDGRGVNLSDKPQGVTAYKLERLVADVLAAADALAPGRPFDLVGHDWGGVVAWAVASTRPDRLRRLIVLNAPHPAVLAAALTDNPEQRTASGYFESLRAPDAEARLSAQEFAQLRAAFHDLHARGLVGAEHDQEAVQAWSRPGALTGALNWYRAAEFARAGGSSPVAAAPLDLPVVLFWGEADRALPVALAEKHRVFCRDLTVLRLPGVGHWSQLERPDELASTISAID